MFGLMNHFVSSAKVDIYIFPSSPTPNPTLYARIYGDGNPLYLCSGFTNLTYLGFRKCCGLNAESMKSLSGLTKLVKLDFERCPLIHGGFIHLEGLLFSLNFPVEEKTLRRLQCLAVFIVSEFRSYKNAQHTSLFPWLSI